jgi:thiamine-monophosphate kinase
MTGKKAGGGPRLYISQIGGEFALIERLAEKPTSRKIIKGIGDDAAVIKTGSRYLVFTTDTLVEGDHFSLKYFTPEQIGKKSVEINVSDIGAMGAEPKFFLVSLVLPEYIDVKIIENIYKGMRQKGDKYKIEIIGGNITHGKQLIIDIFMIGEVKKKNLKLRAAARPGDLIFVSGELGASTAGLKLFLKNKKGFNRIKKRHLEPEAKFGKVRPFLKYINAMIDVSDGLASEVTRICEQSNTGAVIYPDLVPINPETIKAAESCKENALDYALYGGEDFELVYTTPRKNENKVKGFMVGEITSEKGVRLLKDSREEPLSKHGYDHFLN